MARILILSDIHSNLAALDAVLADAGEGGGFDEVWSLGDSVGYGPQPNECVSKLRALGALAVMGNHELVALGEIPIDDFNPYAAAAAKWTIDQITEETTAYLRSVPRRAEAHGFTLVHGSPRDPVWEYINGNAIAAANVEYMNTAYCVFGHTHKPAVHLVKRDGGAIGDTPDDGDSVTLGGGWWLINPGSVGQPRDGDSRSAYAVLDTADMSVSFHRVEYDIALTQSLMVKAGLPSMPVERLAVGR